MTHPGMTFLAAVALVIVILMIYGSTVRKTLPGGVQFNNNTTGLNNPNIQQGPNGRVRGSLPPSTTWGGYLPNIAGYAVKP